MIKSRPAQPGINPVSLAVILLALLTLLTTFVFTIYPPFLIDTKELLPKTDFSDPSVWEFSGLQRQRIHADEAIIVMHESDQYNTTISQHIKGENLPDTFWLEWEFQLSNVSTGEKSWQRAGLIILAFDDAGNRIASESAVSAHGSYDWHRRGALVSVPTGSKHIAVQTRLLKSSGQLAIKEVSLKAAQKQAWADAIRYAFIGLWVVSVTGMFVSIVRVFGINTPMLSLILLGCLLLVGILMRDTTVTNLESQIIHVIPQSVITAVSSVFDIFLPGYITGVNQIISKLGHWLVFFVLAFTAVSLFHRSSVFLIILALITLACATEALQYLTSGRSPRINDVLIDLAGAFVGMLIAMPIRFLRASAAKHSATER